MANSVFSTIRSPNFDYLYAIGLTGSFYIFKTDDINYEYKAISSLEIAAAFY